MRPHSTGHTSQFILASVTMSFITLGLTIGCGVSGTETAAPAKQISVALQGLVYGGQQLIYGSTIGFWQAGTSSYGAGATNLMTSTVTTGKDGSFSLAGKYTACLGTILSRGCR